MPEIAVCRVSDVAPGGVIRVDKAGHRLAVVRIGDDWYAIDDQCPHAGASLSGGSVEDLVVTCPWHYWRFRLTDGAWADNPRIKTGCYPVHVVGDEIQVEVPDKK